MLPPALPESQKVLSNLKSTSCVLVKVLSEVFVAVIVEDTECVPKLKSCVFPVN